jgi:aspartate racemase
MARQRLIGLIGGMSWESSAVYYRRINEAVQARLGGVSSARCLLWSFDFREIEILQKAGNWDEAAAGAELLIICTNTMHKMADEVQGAVAIPLLHIADPTGEAIEGRELTKVGLLGTAFTMEEDFYKTRLARNFGLEVLVPAPADRAEVHRVIYEELVRGVIVPGSREALKKVISRLAAAGAQAIILGCTELMLLVRPEDSALPLFDTTDLHAKAAVARALGGVGQPARD